ncbi:MAG: glycine cleavage system protein GcvH [Thermodesulfobacteriota bacterium]|nr:glycine cleavage system protein GcvH [Thermodesulfobacteriota bacterium]
MNLPKDLKYTKEHEWARLEDKEVVVGITDFAQSELGDVVYVELSAKGEKVEKDKPFGVIESVKAVSDLYSPISGNIIQINSTLDETPQMVNDDPYGEGWIVRIMPLDISELKTLLSASEYEEFIKENI